MKQAQAAIQRGDVHQACIILRDLIIQDPRNEQAWLLLAQVVDKREHTIDCLERVLYLNPRHEKARKALAVLDAKKLPSVSLPQEPLGTASNRGSWPADGPDLAASLRVTKRFHAVREELEWEPHPTRRLPSWLLTRYWVGIVSNWRRSSVGWRIFFRNWLAVFGVVLLLIYTLMAVAHPLLMATVWPKGIYDPQVGYDMDIFPHPSSPSTKHLLGTDTQGHDVLSMLLAATTPTYVLALTAGITTAVVSTLIGAISAYQSGMTDMLFTHLSDLALLTPAPLVMVVIGGTIDISPVEFGILYGLIAGIGGAAIVMRSQALTIITKPFIEASRVAGAGGTYIILRHLIPNMLPLATVQMLLSVTGAVFAYGFSSFLGLSRTRLNWGSMVYSSFINLNISPSIAWNVLISSAVTISLFAASFYFIARGVHEVVEPHLREKLV